MMLVKNNENAPEKHSETINKKTGKGRLIADAIITLIINLLTVYYYVSGSGARGLAGAGVLIFSGLSIGIDILWLIRFAIWMGRSVTKREESTGGNNSKWLYALIAVLLLVVLLASLAIAGTTIGFFIFCIPLIVCEVLAILLMTYGIKRLYSKCFNGRSPKRLFILLTIAMHIAAVIAAIPMVNSRTEESARIFGVFASVCIVTDLIWNKSVKEG